jgi:hypothetical protein
VLRIHPPAAGYFSRPSQVDAGYWYFPWVYHWFCLLEFSGLSAQILEEYLAINPDLCLAARAAYDDTKDVGFQTADSHLWCLGSFRDDWIRHCEATLLRDLVGQGKVLILRDTTTKLVSDIFDDRTEADVRALRVHRI